MGPSHAIGILTFHRCINYGSYWQARCLVEGLQGLGYDAVILDHHSTRVNRVEWKCALRPVPPTTVSKNDISLYRCKMSKFFAAIDELPLSSPFDLDDPSTMEARETVVVGSDEVWNLCHPWYRWCPLFFGDGVKTRRLVSYAASFGTYHCWNGLDQYWAEKLRRFDAISVRDENSWWLIKNGLGIEAEMVLDPCLLFQPAPKGKWNGPGTPFIALYGHNFSPWFIREVRHCADRQDLPLVSIGYRNDWADEQWLEAGPHDFTHAMMRARSVATNFFHGCIFALRYARPFVCETMPYRANKIQCLMAAIGDKRHLVSEATPSFDYDSLLCHPLEPGIEQRIGQKRQCSLSYIEQAIY